MAVCAQTTADNGGKRHVLSAIWMRKGFHGIFPRSGLRGRDRSASAVSAGGVTHGVPEHLVVAGDETGIEALWSRRAKELSTGDQRLVEIARILAGGFSVALLDESASGLDAAARRRFSDLLVHVSAELGLTLIVVEHDLSLIEEVANKLVVLGSGKVVRSGDTREVLDADDVRELYTALPATAKGSVTP